MIDNMLIGRYLMVAPSIPLEVNIVDIFMRMKCFIHSTGPLKD